jgi:outer membrane lipoprotein SlyB
MKRIIILVAMAIGLVGGPAALAQKSGQSAKITVGKVEQAQRVQLQSEAPKGALVGGALGWAATRNKSSAKQAGGALVGATAGGAVASSSQGSRQGMQYVVRTGEGTAITVITDQTQIRVGDCVTVEETSRGANVRRGDPAMCEPKAAQAVAELESEFQEEAQECDAAKQELIKATTAEQVEVARLKMQILCND